jgi:hypothetical protein
MWWQVEIPTTRTDGCTEVRGVQTFMFTATSTNDAADQALAEVISEPAVRHRRGAAVDFSQLTVKPWDLGSL